MTEKDVPIEAEEIHGDLLVAARPHLMRVKSDQVAVRNRSHKLDRVPFAHFRSRLTPRLHLPLHRPHGTSLHAQTTERHIIRRLMLFRLARSEDGIVAAFCGEKLPLAETQRPQRTPRTNNLPYGEVLGVLRGLAREQDSHQLVSCGNATIADRFDALPLQSGPAAPKTTSWQVR